MERALVWNDPELAIDWPIEIGLETLVSAKDAVAATFAECEKYDFSTINLRPIQA